MRENAIWSAQLEHGGVRTDEAQEGSRRLLVHRKERVQCVEPAAALPSVSIIGDKPLAT